MHSFPDHIAGLLADHDCVIVPALGAFLASREPARIDNSGRRLLPPRRRIAFNVFLRKNDGLLAQRLVETEHFTYPEAVRHVEHFASSVLHRLENGEPYHIARVGILSMNQDATLSFSPEPENILDPENFGLSPVSLPQFVTPSDRQSPQGRRETRKPAVTKKLLRAAAVAGALLWFSFNVYLITRESGQQASLPSLDSVRPGVILKDSAQQPKVLQSSPAKPDTVFVASVAPVNAPTHASIVKEDTATAVPGVAQNQVDQHFFVIAGAFKQPGNAQALVRELQGRGFSNARIIDTVGTLLYVCYDGFSAAPQAEALLTDLRAKQEKGWIYRN